MKKKATITDSSIESAGIAKDYKDAVIELIWNGFDAKATTVDINYDPNSVDHIDQIRITDNGSGINYSTLDETFGFFLDSAKRASFQRSSYNKGKKGKGRFSFSAFAGKATWETIFKEKDKFLKYNLTILKNKKDEYEDTKTSISKTNSTGTSVLLEELFGVTGYSFESNDFKDYLAKEFGWFLFLNRNADFSININGEPLEFNHLIADNYTTVFTIKDEDQTEFKFAVTYLRWVDKIGEKFYYYYLNSEKNEVGKSLTSFNNNAIGFHHSVFVESNFFDSYDLSDAGAEGDNLFTESSANNRVFKALNRDLKEFLTRKEKEFVRGNAAEELISRYESAGVLPRFGNNKYDLERKKDLVNVVKELYCVQPKVFKGLKREQQSTFIGFLNLLLDTDERENILEIIEGVVKLSSEEREELVGVLKKTSFSKILSTIKLIENRFKIVELLRRLVFDHKKFTTERDHVQKAIEENYWLFGEQYHLASADKNFQTLLSKYLHIIDGVEAKKIQSYDWKRRPDIFMCRKLNSPDPHDSEYNREDNIMVELKRPAVTIGKEQFRQIDDYLDFIMKEDQFNSQTRRWKFYVISNRVDDYIEKQYSAFKDKGKRFLVHQAGKYEIYALTWDDLFRTFEIKHNYLLDKLEFDKSAIQEELQLKGVKLDVTASNEITDQIIDLSKT